MSGIRPSCPHADPPAHTTHPLTRAHQQWARPPKQRGGKHVRLAKVLAQKWWDGELDRAVSSDQEHSIVDNHPPWPTLASRFAHSSFIYYFPHRGCSPPYICPISTATGSRF